MKKALILLLALVLVFSLVSCGKKSKGSSGDLIPVKYVVPRSTECLDDAHFWAAVKMGYFEEEGLDVSIEQSVGTTDVKMVSVGQAEFACPSPMGLMTAIENEMPLISVYQIDTTQIYGICVPEDSDMHEVGDIANKTVVLGDASWQAEFEVFLPSFGVAKEDVSYVVGGENRAQMVDMGRADCVWTWEKEYQLWQAQGMKLRYISFQEAYPACANSLICTTDTLKNNPDLIVKFCKAYSKGLIFCKENPLAAADIVCKQFPSLNLTAEQALPAIHGLVNITNDIHTETYGYGWHDEYEWQLNEDGAIATGIVTQDIPVTEYYTNELVEAINDFDPAPVIEDAANYSFD